MSTHRLASAVWWLANTNQLLSSRDDMLRMVARSAGAFTPSTIARGLVADAHSHGGGWVPRLVGNMCSDTWRRY
jgi:hypothetical protein